VPKADIGIAAKDQLYSITWSAFRGTGRYGISGLWQFHCGLMPANLTTLPHFRVSSAMSLPKSAGDPGSAVAPVRAGLI
jgi:hypothetical protein